MQRGATTPASPWFKNGRTCIDVQSVGNPAPSAMHLLEQASEALHIEGCMNALDGSYRQSLALAYYQGQSML